MTLNDIKDAIDNSGRVIIRETRIPWGVQLELAGSSYVNVYESGTCLVQGRDCQLLRKAIDSWVERVRANKKLYTAGVRGMVFISVSGVKSVLEEAGFPLLRESRLADGSGTQIGVWGRNSVTVYKTGRYAVQGEDRTRIEDIIEAALRTPVIVTRYVRPFVDRKTGDVFPPSARKGNP